MKKVLLAAFICMSMLLTTVPLTACAQSDTGSAYSDISGKWYTNAVTEYGYTEIFSDGSNKFNANNEITRIEFARLLHRALDININYFTAPNVKDCFDDMKTTDVGVSDLIDLTTIGIVERGGGFNPDKPIARDEMTHWVLNALKFKTNGNYPIPMVKPVLFNDDGEISDTYRGEVYSSVVLNLVSGRGNNMLFPKDGATRAEAVTIVSNLMTLVESYKPDVNVTVSAQLAGDGSLTMLLTIRNSTDKTVIINHTSGRKYDYRLFDAAGNNIYTWSADKMFNTLINETVIEPGKVIVFSDTLASGVYNAINPVDSLKAYIVGTSDDFSIDTNGYVTAIVK